jgi:hypothetical protein
MHHRVREADMIAFTDIKAETRRSCAEIGHPFGDGRQQPARVARGEEHQVVIYIEPWMEGAFGGLARAAEDDSPFALVSCFMNGEPPP